MVGRVLALRCDEDISLVHRETTGPCGNFFTTSGLTWAHQHIILLDLDLLYTHRQHTGSPLGGSVLPGLCLY